MLSSRCRTDHNVNLPLPRLGENASLLRAGAKTRQATHGERIRPDAIEKGLVVLFARTVVGTSTATCRPYSTTLNAARNASSVLP